MFDKNNIEIFSSRDQIRNQLVEYAKSYLDLENLDLNNANYLGYLINILSVLSSNLIYYNSSVWREFFLTKAMQRESVINLALMLGYHPNLAVPASCSVLMEIPLDFEGTLNFKMIGVNEVLSNENNMPSDSPMKFYAGDIPFSVKYTTTCSITNTNGIYNAVIIQKRYLESTQENNISIPYKISNNVLRFYVDVMQIDILRGSNLEFTFEDIKPYAFYTKDIRFDGDLSEIKIFTNDTGNVTTQYITAKSQTYINPLIPVPNESNLAVSWKLYDSLFLIPENEYGFTYKQIDGGIRLFFGNGIIGMQPTAGHTCRILLGVTKGSLGNIVQGAIDKADKIITEPTGVLKFNALNTEPAFGGKDIPTIDEIRAEAIAQVSANKRLITKNDYDYMSMIMDPGDLPINNSVHVLKRSDIGRNEITLFVDLVYHTIENESYVVPTRSYTADFLISQDGLIRTGDELGSEQVGIETITYVSMFNIVYDSQIQQCKYFYILSEISKPFIISRNVSSETFISITSCDFKVITGNDLDEDRLIINLNYSVFNNNPQNQILPSQLFCQVLLPDGTLVLLDNDVLRNRFTLEDSESLLFIKDLPYGEINFIFYIYDSLSDRFKQRYDEEGEFPRTIEEAKRAYMMYGTSSVIVKEDLSEFMYSPLRPNPLSPETYIIAYDIPALEKKYYDKINKSLFEIYVLSKIAAFDVTKYRMLTDFVNLKFSNTVGLLSNLGLNPVTKEDVFDIDPPDEILLESYEVTIPPGTRYAVSKYQSSWTDKYSVYGPFIATRLDSQSNPQVRWNFERLLPNDIFIVEEKENQKYIFNGDRFFPLSSYIGIPIQIEIIVWVDYNDIKSSQAFIQQIKDELINEFYPRFGYEKTIFISEIVKIVRNIPGVLNCKVVKPEFDIQFLYDIKDFTLEQLLTYSPQLVYFDSSSIEIELR